MNRYCFALDLIDDPALIAEYEVYHQNVWPEIFSSMRNVGIETMEIYRTGSRLFMIMETNDDFSLETKAAADAINLKVKAWEKLMWKYQQALPNARPGEKWILMDQIFKL